MTAWLRVMWRGTAGIAVTAALLATPASAQQMGADFAVRVTVTDSTGKAIDLAEVLVRSGRRVVATARTSSAGTATIGFAADSATAEVVVRKLGFRPVNRFVRLVPGDTASIARVLGGTVQTLGEVRVTARESTRRRSYFLDAETIASSARPIRSALDAIVALRPYMLTSIGGRRVCGLIQEVWINGQRIPQNFAPDPRMEHRLLPGVNPKNPVAPEVLTILASIRPEHIQEMSYIDCFGGPVHAVGSRNAVFIVLKEGIEYRWPAGTFVAGDSTSQM
jgi:hypothetical protein